MLGHAKNNENLLRVSRKTFTPWQSLSGQQINYAGTARFNAQKYSTQLPFLQKQIEFISCHYKHMQNVSYKEKNIE